MSTPAPFLLNCLRFAETLRLAGIPVGLDQVLAFTEALALVDLAARPQVFFAARCTLIRRHEHLRLFEALFNRFWQRPLGEQPTSRQRMPRAPRHRGSGKPFTVVTYLAAKARQDDPEIEAADKRGTASTTEALQHKDFSLLSPEELQQVRKLIEQLHWQLSLRQTRRHRADRNGRLLDMPAVLRDAARHGGVPLRLHWQRRTLKQRPLILIADISGSMEQYSRLLLQFLYGVAQRLPLVECFVFGTRLTRITPQLKLRNVDRALDAAAHEAVDWAGGTRIAASLHQFNRRWSRRLLGRGAVVLLISDGWEQGEATLLAREAQHLRRRCHRLIWLNPLLGRPTYQPLAGGMQAALAHVDDFLPINNLHSLAALATHLGKLERRRG